MIINGEELPISALAGNNIPALLELYKLDPVRIAIELNGNILKKTEYENTSLADTDKIEIIHFVGGG
jgi:sulfur carrier protein